MYKILYNPLSNNGKSYKIVEKLTKELDDKGLKYSAIDITSIDDADAFIKALDEKDEAIILGGDGTLHRLANRITHYLREKKIKNKIYLYRAGTGNDFSRDVKKNFKDNMVYLNDYLTDLPLVKFNDKVRYFVNGVGLGIDALICKMVDASKNKTKMNYFKNVLKSLKNYKKTNVRVVVDGKEYIYKKALFASVMHGRYFGGGMKITPKQKRNTEEVSLIVINRLAKPLLALLLPTVFFGGHTIFPMIHIHKGKNIEVHFEDEKYLQLDGEVEENIKSIRVYKKPL